MAFGPIGMQLISLKQYACNLFIAKKQGHESSQTGLLVVVYKDHKSKLYVQILSSWH